MAVPGRTDQQNSKLTGVMASAKPLSNPWKASKVCAPASEDEALRQRTLRGRRTGCTPRAFPGPTPPDREPPGRSIRTSQAR